MLSQKIESIKELIRGNELLKKDLEITKNEVKSLKLQVGELEKSEKMLKSILRSNNPKVLLEII